MRQTLTWNVTFAANDAHDGTAGVSVQGVYVPPIGCTRYDSASPCPRNPHKL